MGQVRSVACATALPTPPVDLRVESARPTGRLWPVAACHDQDSISARPAAPRRKRSFKDGLTEQMNSFDECRLSPISRPSTVGEIVSAIGSNRPEAVIRATLDRGRQGDRRCLPVRKGEPKWRPYGVGRARAATDANFRPPDIVCAELRHEMIGCCPDVA